MSIIVEKPYRFVPPHRGDGWPNWIQRLRLVDLYLWGKEGIVDWETRNLEVVRESVRSGDGVILAPNHCRYADPLVMGWPARELKQHVYAIASWHLFNKNRFESFAIRKMGGFSLFREGSDRRSLETAIEIIATGQRPLIVFPEGTTNRTNDRLQPLLDGVSFLARSAARRRRKAGRQRVVIHPVGIKYVLLKPIDAWADRALAKIENQLGWRRAGRLTLLQRVEQAANGILSLAEIEWLGGPQPGDLHQRRVRLIERLLEPIEHSIELDPGDAAVLPRVRRLRTKLLPRLVAAEREADKRPLRWQLRQVDLAQKLDSYPDGYLRDDPVTDTRVLETIQRLQEDFFGKPDRAPTMKAVISFANAIEVPAEKTPRGHRDPVLQELDERLRRLLETLQHEARPFGG